LTLSIFEGIYMASPEDKFFRARLIKREEIRPGLVDGAD
jgi:hypothetical protein